MQNSWLTWFRPPSAGKVADRPRPQWCCNVLLFAMLLIALPGLSQQSARGVHYTIDLARRSEHLAHITMQFPCNGTCDVQLPVWNALYQVRDFAQYVRDLSAKSGNTPLSIHVIDKTTWRITGATGEALLEYSYLAELAAPFGAEVNEHHAFFNLALVLMYPTNSRNTPAQLQITGIPQGWNVATAMDHAATQTFTGYASQNYDRMVDTPIE